MLTMGLEDSMENCGCAQTGRQVLVTLAEWMGLNVLDWLIGVFGGREM